MAPPRLLTPISLTPFINVLQFLAFSVSPVPFLPLTLPFRQSLKCWCSAGLRPDFPLCFFCPDPTGELLSTQDLSHQVCAYGCLTCISIPVFYLDLLILRPP